MVTQTNTINRKEEEEAQVTIPQPQMAKPAPISESPSPLNIPNVYDLNQDDPNAPPSSSLKDPIASKIDNVNKAKSGEGYRYYSRLRTTDLPNSLYVGVPRSFPVGKP